MSADNHMNMKKPFFAFWSWGYFSAGYFALPKLKMDDMSQMLPIG